MRIAIDCRMISGSGIGVVTRGIVSRLPAGHEYVLIGRPDELAEFERPGVAVHPCSIAPFSPEELFFRSGPLKADALLVPSFSLFGFLHERRFIMVHDVLFLDRPEFCGGAVDRLVKMFYVRLSCFFSRKIFTDSRFSRDRILDTVKPGRPVTIVPLGVLEEGLPASGTKKDPNLLVFVGNLKKHKNLRVVFEALSLPELAEREFRLVVVGSGEGMRTSDRDLAGHSFVQEKPAAVSFAGKLDRREMLSLMAAARYLIQPSLYEGFSLPPIEAFFCGTQPIVSDIPVHREIYGNSLAAFFDPSDPAALAKLILREPEPIPEGYGTKFAETYGFSYENCVSLVLREMTP